MTRPIDRDALRQRVLAWYADHARDLPWRRSGVSPWQILISEVMLQQTPVARVVEPWQRWIERWPTPAAQAAATTGEALAAWGRLGYPRRGLRIHQAACAIVADHAGEVPDTVEVLRTLPGIGEYTAASVASFGYGRRALVIDTNVRRVFARVEAGKAQAAASLTVAERATIAQWLPDDPAEAAIWAVASMELGALICTAANPRCEECPISDGCAWYLAGRPDAGPRVRGGQAWHGTKRQCRGLIMQALRESEPRDAASLTAFAVDHGWADPAVVPELIQDLVGDGLIHPTDGGFALGS